MNTDDDDDDDDDDDAMLSHYNAMALVATLYLEEEVLTQKKVAVLALCHQCGVSSTPDHLTAEAFDIFYDMLQVLGHDWKGSVKGKSPNIERGQEAAHQQLVADYFSSDASTYSDSVFRWRFRMGRPLLMQIVVGVTAVDPYFTQVDHSSCELLWG